MSLADVFAAARIGRLYPSVILHGGGADEREAAAVELARGLLCDREAAARPCGDCRHCRRVAAWSGGGERPFHADFHVLERDLKTVTSVQATRALLRNAQVSPYEARGQVFVVAAAESLSGEAANALLKSLEEPHATSPRHFLLLAPSQYDLLPTLRSRSLAIFLGAAPRPAGEELAAAAAALAAALEAFAEAGNGAELLAAAAVLHDGARWDDARAAAPWERAAAIALASRDGVRPALRLSLADLAVELMGGARLRLRGIQPQRILEGQLARCFAAARPAAAGG